MVIHIRISMLLAILTIIQVIVKLLI